MIWIKSGFRDKGLIAQLISQYACYKKDNTRAGERLLGMKRNNYRRKIPFFGRILQFNRGH
jgi:hypothetical protein